MDIKLTSHQFDLLTTSLKDYIEVYEELLKSHYKGDGDKEEELNLVQHIQNQRELLNHILQFKEGGE